MAKADAATHDPATGEPYHPDSAPDYAARGWCNCATCAARAQEVMAAEGHASNAEALSRAAADGRAWNFGSAEQGRWGACRACRLPAPAATAVSPPPLPVFFDEQLVPRSASDYYMGIIASRSTSQVQKSYMNDTSKKAILAMKNDHCREHLNRHEVLI